MFGFYIKHSIYNKYLGFNKDNLRVWTSKQNAYLYFTQLNAEVSVKAIKREPKYKNVKLIIVNKSDLEINN